MQHNLAKLFVAKYPDFDFDYLGSSPSCQDNESIGQMYIIWLGEALATNLTTTILVTLLYRLFAPG